MKFKTVKEFLSALCNNDYSFVQENDGYGDYACFEISKNMILIYTHYGSRSWKDRNLVDTIYGHFHSEGGHIDLQAENYWAMEFSITDEELLVGTTYKIRCPKVVEKVQPSVIEL